MAANNLYFYLVDLYRGTTLESIVSLCERIIIIIGDKYEPMKSQLFFQSWCTINPPGGKFAFLSSS